MNRWFTVLLLFLVFLIGLNALEIPDFNGAPFWVRVFGTLAVWFIIWAAIWVRPSKKEPEEKAKDATAITMKSVGPNSRAVYVAGDYYEGVSKTDAKKIAFEAAQQAMATVIRPKKDSFADAYPNGCAFFTITDTQEIIEFTGFDGQLLHFDWKTANLSLDKDRVWFTPPSIVATGGVMFDNQIGLLRKVGEKASYATVQTDNSAIGYFIEIVASEIHGVVVVFGSKPVAPRIPPKRTRH